jgi:hypothetical protein
LLLHVNVLEEADAVVDHVVVPQIEYIREHATHFELDLDLVVRGGGLAVRLVGEAIDDLLEPSYLVEELFLFCVVLGFVVLLLLRLCAAMSEGLSLLGFIH